MWEGPRLLNLITRFSSSEFEDFTPKNGRPGMHSVAYWLGPEEVSKKNDASIGNPSVHANHFTAR
jgi:hypothetical protein